MSGRFAVTILLVFATVAYCEVKGQQSFRSVCTLTSQAGYNIISQAQEFNIVDEFEKLPKV